VGRRRRRKIIKRVVKRIPSIFICPYCGSRSITIEIDEKVGEALVRCGKCGVNDKVKYTPPSEEVDIYNRFMDKYYERSA
jgi:transcription elongation factor Elf1